MNLRRSKFNGWWSMMIIMMAVAGLIRPQASSAQLFDPDSILTANDSLPSVLLVGCFHFAYPNLDAHKTSKDDQVDVLSSARQKEVEQLAEYIARFRPTMLVVESGRNTGYLMKKYRDYLAGKHKLEPDERQQIGFRLMKWFKLDTLYGVDARTLADAWYDGPDSICIRPALDTLYEGWDFRSDDAISHRYTTLFGHENAMLKKQSLFNYFRYLNSVKRLERDYGAYLTGDFKLGNTRGADALAMHWYNRNLRIFRNIQQLPVNPSDRILILTGAGHTAILHQLFKCSPEYRLVEFNELK